MELRIWLLLIIVLCSGFAVVLSCAAVFYLGKRVKTMETRIADWDLWSDCVDNAVDPVVSAKIKAAYTERKRRAAN